METAVFGVLVDFLFASITAQIERVKQLLMTENLSLTEISFMMNYSSVAYLSQQFKNITGVTPTTFQKIMKQKRTAEQQL